MNILRYKNLYFAFSGVLVGASIALIAVFGLNFGIDFLGGSILEGEYATERPLNEEIHSLLSAPGLGSLVIQPTGETGVILRMQFISQELHEEVVARLGENFTETRFEAIGPVIGRELRGQVLIMILLALFVLILYITIAFRRITEPVRSWQYGLTAFLVLIHDLLIPLGLFALLGRVMGTQVTIPIVIGLLTVLGYSINDTVVVFDRIRENLLKRTGIDFTDTVNKSLRQTIGRSLSTSFSTLLVLFAVYFLGGSTLKDFSLILIVGIIVGSYSSIFIAPPLLVAWVQRRKNS